MDRTAMRQVNELIEQGRAFQQAGQVSQARQTWQEAKQLALSIRPMFWQVNALRAVIKALAKAQQWQDAEQIIASIEDAFWRVRTYRSLAKILVKARQWQEAERITLSIDHASYRAAALRYLVKDLAKAHLWQEAELVVSLIEETPQRILACLAIVPFLAKAGHLSQAQNMRLQAEQLASLIAPASFEAKDGSQMEAVYGVIHFLAQAYKWQAAWHVASCLPNYAQHSAAFPYIRAGDTRIGAFAEALTESQQWQEAEQIALSIQDPQGRDWLLYGVARALASAQQWQEAERVALSIEDAHSQCQVLSDVVAALAAAQQWQEAERIAFSMQDSSRLLTYQAEAVNHLACALVHAHQRSEGVRIALRFQNISGRSYILRNLASIKADQV